jgi:putative transposase
MVEIIALLNCLSQCLEPTTLRQLGRVVPAVLAMTGRVTMLGISRWSEKGGSYRTVQRLFSATIPWAKVSWLFFRQHLLNSQGTYIVAGDETVVTKAGRKTFGLDRFFSSLYDKPVPGLKIFALSLIHVQERTSYPLVTEQVIRSTEDKTATQAKKQAKQQRKSTEPKGKPGRPKGSKNKDKTQIEWTTELQVLNRLLGKLLELVLQTLSVTYVVLDGQFGNNNALQVVRQAGSLHLICKLRYDSALYFRFTGEYSGRGPRPIYGDKINYRHMAAEHLVKTATQRGIRTDIYQTVALHECFAQPLNVVVILKTNLQTQAQAHVILFSSDLDLAYDQLIDYYSLRFQIEFNFRDAKQYWGLEDFMNVQETQVTNAFNLSFFMVNVSHRLLRDLRCHQPEAGVLDLKTFFRSRRYVTEVIKTLDREPYAVSIQAAFDQVAKLGAIHQPIAGSRSP